MLKARGGLDKGFYYQICPSADSTAKDTLYSQIKAVCFTGHVHRRYFYGLQCKETGSEPSEQQRYCFHKMRYWYVFVCAAIWTRFINKRNHGGGDRVCSEWRGKVKGLSCSGKPNPCPPGSLWIPLWTYCSEGWRSCGVLPSPRAWYIPQGPQVSNLRGDREILLSGLV